MNVLWNFFPQDTVCEEMIADLRFAFLCQSSTKIKPQREEEKQVKGTYFEDEIQNSLSNGKNRIYQQQPNGSTSKQSLTSVRFIQRASFPNGHCDSCALNMNGDAETHGSRTFKTKHQQQQQQQPQQQSRQQQQSGRQQQQQQAQQQQQQHSFSNDFRYKDRSGQSNSCSNLLLTSSTMSPVLISSNNRAPHTFTLRRVTSNGSRTGQNGILPQNSCGSINNSMHLRMNGRQSLHYRSIEDELGRKLLRSDISIKR